MSLNNYFLKFLPHFAAANELTYLEAYLLHLMSPYYVGQVITLQEYHESFSTEEVGRTTTRVEHKTRIGI